MPVAERWQCRRTPLAWWTLAVAVAVALKWQFSAAATSELGWMLRPLALLVHAAAGWSFTRNASGEWESVGAGMVLVRACAGINFMVLSFLGWCWLWRPQAVPGRAPCSPRRWPLLGAALACAWLAALGLNTLRILVIARWQGALEHWLSPADAHRALGLLVYLPALSLQWLLVERRHPARALLAAAGLYAALLVIVPLLTGNATLQPARFAAHAAFVIGALLPLWLAFHLCHSAARLQRAAGARHPRGDPGAGSRP
jgi:exosortase K